MADTENSLLSTQGIPEVELIVDVMGAPVIEQQVEVFGTVETAVDKTLTIPDCAADAKATGDAIADLAEDIIDINEELAKKIESVPDMQGATEQEAGEAGLAPAPAAGDQGKYLRADGTWADVPDPQVMNGATTDSAGTSGLVPAPAAGDQEKMLTGGGTWKLPGVVTINGRSPSPVTGDITVMEGGSGSATYGSYRLDAVIAVSDWTASNGAYVAQVSNALIKSNMDGVETWLDDESVMLGDTSFVTTDGMLTITTAVKPTESWSLHVSLAVNGAQVIADVTEIQEIIGDTALPTTAQTLTGAIAEHESDIGTANLKIAKIASGYELVPASLDALKTGLMTVANSVDTNEFIGIRINPSFTGNGFTSGSTYGGYLYNIYKDNGATVHLSASIYNNLGEDMIIAYNNGTWTFNSLNSNFVPRTKSPYYGSLREISNCLLINNTLESSANDTGIVRSTSQYAPTDLTIGIREVHYYEDSKISIVIHGVNTSGFYQEWYRYYNGSNWAAWQENADTSKITALYNGTATWTIPFDISKYDIIFFVNVYNELIIINNPKTVDTEVYTQTSRYYSAEIPKVEFDYAFIVSSGGMYVDGSKCSQINYTTSGVNIVTPNMDEFKLIKAYGLQF